MFLHVAALGPFADNLFRMFEEAAPGHSTYVGFARNDAPLPPLSTTRVASVGQVLQFVRNDGPWAGMTINGLSDTEMVELARGLPPDLKCAWYVWGFEAYSRPPGLRRRLLKPMTRAATYMPLPTLKAVVGQRARLLWRDVGDLIHPPFDRFDYCVSQLPEEYDLLRRHGLFKRTAYHWGAVGTLEDYVDIDAEVRPQGPDIQIGNSATPVLNHLEAFETIARYVPPGRHVVTPLSYGDAAYREQVVRSGRSLFGDDFVPVIDYLPLADYHNLLESCGIVVMNQMRQHALGNIVSALWRGAVVYMNDTPTYRTMHRLGVGVRRFDDEFAADALDGFPPLTTDQVVRNREILVAHQGRERVVAATESLLTQLQRVDC